MNFVHPEDVTKSRAAYADVIAGRNVVHFINRYRCKDGAYRWLESGRPRQQRNLAWRGEHDRVGHFDT